MQMLLVLLLINFLVQEGRVVINPTADPAVYNIVYNADFKWNVEITVWDSLDKKKFSKTLKNTDKFTFPFSLDGEESGLYTVEIFTPAYDLKKTINYISWQDQLKDNINIVYNSNNKLIRVSSSVMAKSSLTIEVINESGDRLVNETLAPNTKITRAYNLGGASANSIEVIISVDKSVISTQEFEF